MVYQKELTSDLGLSTKRKRIPNSLFHNDMFVILNSPEKNSKLKVEKITNKRRTEPIQTALAVPRKVGRPRSMSNLGKTPVKPKKPVSPIYVQYYDDEESSSSSSSDDDLDDEDEYSPEERVPKRKRFEEFYKQAKKHTPKVALKLRKSSSSFTTPTTKSPSGRNNQPVRSDTYYEDEEEEDPRFRVGSKFNSFSEFYDIYESWKSKRNHSFRVASSETLKNIDGTLDMRCRYRYVVYQCIHYGQPRVRGTGKRPNQNYLPCGCEAMMRLVYNFDEKALVINKLHTTHYGHNPSLLDEYQSSAKRRGRAFKSHGLFDDDESVSGSPTVKIEAKKEIELPKNSVKDQKMTDALYYQQQLQLVAALLPQAPVGSTTNDYSALLNNINLANYVPTLQSIPQLIQPQYTLSAVQNSAFSRVQPVNMIYSSDCDKNKENDVDKIADIKIGVNTFPNIQNEIGSPVQNQWGHREYADIAAL